jgi:putative peptidoglycan lipid II flippase
MRSSGSDRGTIVRNAGVVGVATMTSRVLGLVRDAVLAYMLGATEVADAFFVAFRIPNLLRQLFGEGALAASFVPVYTDVRQKGGEEKSRLFAGDLFTLLVLILTVLTVLGIVFAPLLVRFIAMGFDPSTNLFQTTVQLTRWMLPYLVFICAAALGMGVLNSHGHFLVPAAAPALLNISIISFALLISPKLSTPVLGVAWGVLAGGFLQFFVQIPPMERLRVLPVLRMPQYTPEVKRLLLLMAPAILGVTVYQLNILVDTIVASFLPTGSITYLWYGNRMMQFPLGVFGIALATAALPTLSKQVAEGRNDDFTGTVSFSLALTAFIGFPAAMGLIALREPIMATLFGRGAFDALDVSGAGQALLYYAMGLPLFIGVKILGRAFFALENTRIPFSAAGVAFIFNALLDLILMGPMGHSGLALATSIASFVNFMILARSFTLRTGNKWLDNLLMRESLSSLVSASIMLVITAAAASRVPWMELSGLKRAVMLSGCVALGIGVYLVAARIFGCKGLKILRKNLFKRSRS